MSIPRFSIFYGDGSVWRSDVDGSWNDAPAEDVQVVMIEIDAAKGYRQIVQGEDDYRLPQLGSAVKYGKWMPARSYNALVRRALRDG